MPDVYATIEAAPEAVQHQLADVLELRAADVQQRAMLEDYLAQIPPGGRVLEIGCGTGAICRRLAQDAGEVVGIDPSPVFIARARELAGDLQFEVADGRALPFGDDRSTPSSATPRCATSRTANACWPRRTGWLGSSRSSRATMRRPRSRSPTTIRCRRAPTRRSQGSCTTAGSSAVCLGCSPTAAGRSRRRKSHGYTETADPGYALTLVDRGAGLLAAAGSIGEETAAALRAEARRRVEAGTFYGHITYASFIASRAASSV